MALWLQALAGPSVSMFQAAATLSRLWCMDLMIACIEPAVSFPWLRLWSSGYRDHFTTVSHGALARIESVEAFPGLVFECFKLP